VEVVNQSKDFFRGRFDTYRTLDMESRGLGRGEGENGRDYHSDDDENSRDHGRLHDMSPSRIMAWKNNPN
jgi:hypothetical protein